MLKHALCNVRKPDNSPATTPVHRMIGVNPLLNELEKSPIPPTIPPTIILFPGPNFIIMPVKNIPVIDILMLFKTF
jgi:hypothetical protein